MKRNFTLVELLVVTVIIGIIVGAVVPAFSRLMTGNAVSYGLRMTTSQLNMARTEACARRKYVAVVFPFEKDDLNSDNDNISIQSSFRSCYVDKNGTNYTFNQWVPGTKWEFLPKGAIFKSPSWSGVSITDINKNTASPGSPSNNPDPKGVLKEDLASVGYAIVFDPTGKPLNGGNHLEVYVQEGIFTGNNESSPIRENKYNWCKVIVNKNTGVVRAVQGNGTELL